MKGTEMLAAIALAAILHVPAGDYHGNGIIFNDVSSVCPVGDTTIQDPNGIVTCQGPVFIQSSPTVIYQSSPVVYGNGFNSFGFGGFRGNWGGNHHHGNR
jgi:hypothetical protein